MIKRIFLVFFILVLSSCTLKKNDTTGSVQTPEGFTEVTKEDFSISISSNWREVFPEEMSADMPNRDVVYTIFRNNSVENGIIPNIVVTRKKLEEQISTLDFAYKNKDITLSLLNQFKIIQDKKINLSSKETLFLEFIGKHKIEDNSMRYMQTFAIVNGYGYVFTGITSENPSDDLKKTMEKIILSIELNKK